MVLYIFGQVRLDPDNRIDLSRLTGLVKLDSAIHSSVVGNRQVAHSLRFRLLHKLLRAAKTIQQRVLAMDMQVSKVGTHEIPPSLRNILIYNQHKEHVFCLSSSKNITFLIERTNSNSVIDKAIQKLLCWMS